MKFKGKDLEFISIIYRDGSGIKPISKEDSEMYNDDKFTLSCLSISEGTFIASGMNSFVVKQKPKIQSSTNSEIGSYHWYHTLVGRCKAMGEFIKEKGQPNEGLLKVWGERLFNDAEELLKGHEYINKQ